MEVIYDLDTEAAGLCKELGVNLYRAATVGTHPAFISMIRRLIVDPAAEPCASDCCVSARPAARPGPPKP
jgi:ferrochelatase